MGYTFTVNDGIKVYRPYRKGLVFQGSGKHPEHFDGPAEITTPPLCQGESANRNFRQGFLIFPSDAERLNLLSAISMPFEAVNTSL